MKRILIALVLLVSLVSACLCVSAEEPPHASHRGADYKKYSVTGANSGNNAEVNVFEFNPSESGLVPFAFAGNAGNVAVAEKQVELAENAGYDVVAAINGSFFEMATGAPCGTLISGGKLIFTHYTRSEPMATFDADGKCAVVTSTLKFVLEMTGSTIENGIGLVNKVYAATGMATKDITGNYHYYDSNAGNIENEEIKGTEIIFEKKTGSNLVVGRTLKGTAIEVKKDSHYGATKVESDEQFVLFVTNGSMYSRKASNSRAGDEVSITVEEANSRARSAMNNAVSAIGGSYFLVKAGTDITDTADSIVHSTTLQRAWTAFGVKEDGSYVFFTSEEGGLSLKDVADEMVKLGCKDVVRLDGGGSTSMYVLGEGAVMRSERAVCDVLLVVGKDSIKPLEEEVEEPEVSEDDISEIASEVVSEPYEEVSEPIGSVDNSEGESDSNLKWYIIGGVSGFVVVAAVLLLARKKK